MYCYTRAQLHVSAIKFGYLQVVHEKLINRLYQSVWGFYRKWGGGKLGARFRFVSGVHGLFCVYGNIYVYFTAMSRNDLHIELYKGILVNILSKD